MHERLDKPLNLSSFDILSLPQLSPVEERYLIINIAKDESVPATERLDMLASCAHRFFIDSLSLRAASAIGVALLAHRMGKVFSEGKCRMSDHVISATAITADAAIGIVRHLDSQGLSNVAWAYAKMELLDDALFRSLRHAAEPILRTFKPQELSIFAWAFGLFLIKDDKLFKAIGTEAIRQKDKLLPQDVANLLWAYGSLGLQNNKLLDCLVRRCAVFKSEKAWNEQDLAISAFNLAILRPEIVKRVCSPADLDKTHEHVAWLQLYYALLVSNQISPSDYQSQVDAICSGRDEGPLNTSEMDTYDWLVEEVGISPSRIKSQRLVGGILTDFVIEGGIRPLIIEYDGDRYHLTRGPNGGTRRGHDIIQDIIFKKLGYAVLHISEGEISADTMERLKRQILAIANPSKTPSRRIPTQ